MKHEKIDLSLSEIIKQIESHFQNTEKKITLNQNNTFLFQSKKHYVVKTELDGRPVVIKYYNPNLKDSQIRFNQEVNNYIVLHDLIQKNQLQKIKIPQVIHTIPNILVLEFIEGHNFEDQLINHALSLKNISDLVFWLLELHSQGYIFGDQRLRNFIIDKTDHIVGIDFEDIKKGDPMTDIGFFLGAFLDLSPFFKGDFTSIIFEPYYLESMLQMLRLYLTLSPKFIKVESEEKNALFWTEKCMKILEITINRRDVSISSIQMQQIKMNLYDSFEKIFYNNIYP